MTDRQTCAQRLPAHLEGRASTLEALAAVARVHDLETLGAVRVGQLEELQGYAEIPAPLEALLGNVPRAEDALEDTAPRWEEALEELTDADADALAESAREALNDYGLALTVRTQLRWELSTGGPADWLEVDVQRGQHSWEVAGARYVFQDWFDGARQDLAGRELQAVTDALEVLGALEPGIVLPIGEQG